MRSVRRFLRDHLHTVLWWLGLAATAGVLAVFWHQINEEPEPVRPPVYLGWRLIISQIEAWSLLIVAGWGCWLVSARLRHRRRESRTGHPNRFVLTRIVTVCRVIVTTLVTVLTAVVALSAWFFSDTYHVLSPSGPGGCRIVSAHDDVVMVGDYNTIWIATPGHLLLRSAGPTFDFNTGPGVDPAGSGTYRLTWIGTTASLEMWEPGQAGPADTAGRSSITCH